MAEEQEQIELELDETEDTEVEVKEAPNEDNKPEIEVSEDQFEKSDTATQKRIDRLTKKMREAERRETEALNYAKKVQAESQAVKQRMDSLDTSYVNEYTSRVTSQMEQAEKDLARAMELGDTAEAVKVQRNMTALAIESDRANQAKMQQDRYRQQSEAQQQQQVQQPMPQQQPRRPDPKAEDWAENNEWFGQDEAMTYAAFGIHKRLVEEEGFDPQTNDYYSELDRRVAKEFPHKLGNKKKRPAQSVASVSRNTSGRSSGKKVRLTPSQVAIAKKLGVPLEEYAKYVKE
jgi:hypothetical protein